MPKTSRAHSADSGGKPAEPIGGRYFVRLQKAVSEKFIESLKEEGVSAGTIHAIERDNAKRGSAPAHRTRGAAA
jgi:hypothetical protein